MVIDRFYFSGGESAGSLKEFLDVLRNLDKEDFLHHTAEGRNDFANWIRDCVKKKVLANRVGRLKTQKKMIEAIEKELDSPAKVKKGIIDQIKEAMLNGG